MIGLRKLIEAVITNWMPTMAHKVRCQPPSSARILGNDRSSVLG